jgi:hypothetical protein
MTSAAQRALRRPRTRAVEDQSAPILGKGKRGRTIVVARCGLAGRSARLGAPGLEGKRTGPFEQPVRALFSGLVAYVRRQVHCYALVTPEDVVAVMMMVTVFHDSAQADPQEVSRSL